MMLTWQEARRIICETLRARAKITNIEALPLAEAHGRLLAEEIRADRLFPPFDRSTRDGYALRSADIRKIPAKLHIAGELRAGSSFAEEVRPGECVAIMTGAPVPAGADAVVMREYVHETGGEAIIQRSAGLGENIVAKGSEAETNQLLLTPGTRLGYAEMAVAAQAGHTPVRVHERPRLAILSTGDEVVSFDGTPSPFQIRNSNCLSLAALGELSGAEPIILGNAADQGDVLREAIEHGLAEDALVLSGGVSMGKYDLVEEVLASLGGEFFFDAVAIRPGRPAVFGYCQGKPVFGLPGNPISTMVTFELLVAPALDILGGASARELPLFGARLAEKTEQNAKLAHFLPARLFWKDEEPWAEVVPWRGSADLTALAKANCYVCVPQERPSIAKGDWAQVLPRRGLF